MTLVGGQGDADVDADFFRAESAALFDAVPFDPALWAATLSQFTREFLLPLLGFLAVEPWLAEDGFALVDAGLRGAP